MLFPWSRIRKYSHIVILALSLTAFVMPGAFARPQGVKGNANDISAGEKSTKQHKERKSKRDHEGGDELDTSSRAARTHDTAGVEALYTPLSDFVLRYGARGVYQLMPDLQLGLTFLTGSEKLKGVSDAGTAVLTEATISGLALYGEARYFIGNSFSVSSGLGYRTANITYRIEDRSFGFYIDGKLNISSIVIPLFIGNHWTWDNGFTIGCDWAGVMIPIAGSSSASTEGNLGDDSVKQVNDAVVDVGDKLSKHISITLALFKIGYMF